MMYAAIWRALPGPLVVRVLLALVLVLAVVAVLLRVGVPAHRAADAVQRQHRRPQRHGPPSSAHVQARGPAMTRILVVDNYDSFVFTIVGYLQQLGAECEVVRNDAVAPGRRRRLRRRARSRPDPAPPRRPASRWR